MFYALGPVESPRDSETEDTCHLCDDGSSAKTLDVRYIYVTHEPVGFRNQISLLKSKVKEYPNQGLSGELFLE